MNEPIYRCPRAYDLEHAGHEADIDFYIRLVHQLKPARILELGCGTGRITIPLAADKSHAAEEIVGLDRVPEMLRAARAKAARHKQRLAKRLKWVQGDLRTFLAKEKFDLIIAPCGTLCHLLSLKDQLTAWKTVFANLNSGGWFVADVPMAELSVLADSTQVPPRVILQIDNDSSRQQKRLIRYKAVTYRAAEQRAFVRHFYDEFKTGAKPRRFLSDYEHHVYFPRELELLFLATGFTIESMWGDYQQSQLGNRSRSLLTMGRKP